MTNKLKLSLATTIHRDDIDRIRHTVYAEELGQFMQTANSLLRDRPDVESVYITAVYQGELA